MSDLKLRRISVRNWLSIRHAEIEFPERGLVLVTGNNLASGGKLESVGSGKTALGEAISRTLVGIDGRHSTLSSYSYKSKGDTFVDLSVDLLGKPLNVKMGFKCPEMSRTGAALRFKLGDQPEIERGDPLETRQELSNILGITQELAQWSVYIDGDKLRFNKQSERQAVNLLMTALRQPSWDAYQKRASAVLNDAKAALETATGARQTIHDRIVDLEAAVGCAKASLEIEKNRLVEDEKRLKATAAQAKTELETNKTETETLEARQKTIKKRLKELEEAGAAEFHKLEVEKAGIQTKISEVSIKRTNIIEKRAEARATWSSAHSRLNEMQSEPDKCPRCGKTWDKGHSAGELKTQSKAVESAKSAYDKFASQIETVDKTIKDHLALVKEVETRSNSLRASQEAEDLSYESEQNADKLDCLKTAVSDIRLRIQEAQQGPNRTELTRREAILKERSAQAKQAQAAMENAAQKLVEAEELVKVAQYWYDAFGPTGIPNMILSEAITPLNEIARRISLLMTGGTIEITYGTSRELAKGGTSSELVINVKNKIGSSRVEGSSKGEAGLINLIVAETLSEIGSVSNRVGYRWYDEILNSQDQVVRRSILTYLKDMARRLDILIFVVDHHHEAANFADYVLIAEKSDKGTEFYWD